MSNEPALGSTRAGGNRRQPGSRPLGGKPVDAPRFGIMWEVMRSIGDVSLPTFFSSVTVEGQHHVPPSSDPVIICSTHHNTILDVAILSSHMPNRRPLHFWAKSGLFVNPISNFILTSSGNIKVDRRHKNNQALFQGTFQAINNGGAIALFPEGGSYSNPALAKIKSGAAWAALEYTQHLKMQGQHQDASPSLSGQPEKGSLGRSIKIVPAAIVYSDKSKFRSRAYLRFGAPITLDGYVEEFLSSPAFPGSEDFRSSSPDLKDPTAEPTPAHKAAARLTADIQAAIEKMTFNAPDWESFQAVRAARDLIWDLQRNSLDAKELDMRQFVPASNALLALLTLDKVKHNEKGVDGHLVAASRDARRSLFAYACLLRLCDVDNTVLSRMLSRYDQQQQRQHTRHAHQTPAASLRTLPSSSIALGGFLSALRSTLIRLPYLLPTFAPTLLPTYILPSTVAHFFAKKEEESLSSVKTLVGFGFSLILYLFGLSKVLRFTRWNPSGLFLGAVSIWWIVELNRSLVDTAYGLWKQCKLGWSLWRASLSHPSSEDATGTSLPFDSVHPALLKASQDPARTNLFFYGTLVHPKILSRVIGNDGAHLMIQNGILPRHALCHIKGQDYPGLVREEDLPQVFAPPVAARLVGAGRAAVKGTLVCGLTPHDLRCLDAFEDAEYTRRTVSITLDPFSRAATNAERLNRGDAALNLERILAPLTRSRIAQLVNAREETVQRIDAQVYHWTAPFSLLEDRVWEFDAFAREKAKSWVGQRWAGADGDDEGNGGGNGEGRAEMEFEYEIVDAVRQEGAGPLPTPAKVLGQVTPPAQQPEEQQDAWHVAFPSRLTSHRPTREALTRTLQSLSLYPSVQYYVDCAFGPSTSGPASQPKRPRKDDAHLLAALLAGRDEARSSLERLVALAAADLDLLDGSEEAETREGGEVDRALRVIWKAAREDDGSRYPGWPFEVVETGWEGEVDGEARKDR